MCPTCLVFLNARSNHSTRKTLTHFPLNTNVSDITAVHVVILMIDQCRL